MPDTTTINYGFVQPEVGGSNDTWGDKLNADLANIDERIKLVEDSAEGALATSLFTANSLVVQRSTDGPVAIGMGLGTVLGRRLVDGEIAALSYATLKSDLGLSAVENYSRDQLEIYFDTQYAAYGSGGGGAAPPYSLPDFLANIAVAGIADDQILIGTGPNTVAPVGISAFMQGALGAADASAFVTAIAATAVASKSIGSPGFIKLDVGGGETLMLQWGTKAVSGNTFTNIVYPQPYESFSICVGSGGSTNVDHEGDIRVTSCSTVGANLTNSAPSFATFHWLAIGR